MYKLIYLVASIMLLSGCTATDTRIFNSMLSSFSQGLAIYVQVIRRLIVRRQLITLTLH